MRRLQQTIQHLSLVDKIALLTALYMLSTVFFYPNKLFHRSLMFGLYFTMIFFSNNSKLKSNQNLLKYKNIFFSIISIIVTIYLCSNFQFLSYEREVFVDSVSLSQIILGLLTIIVINEGARIKGGWWLPALNIIAILYVFLGQFIPGRFGHLGFELSDFIDSLFLSRYGIWGVTMGTATGTLVFVLLFSTFLISLGFDKFIIRLLEYFVHSSISAFGKIAVLASALFGMITGGGASNVSATGTITIPSMIEKGYSPVFAAAIESTASSASTFTPPVLGSVAFLMSEFIAVDYRIIVMASIIPALLFYFSLFLSVDLRATKIQTDIKIEKNKDSFIDILKDGIPFLVVIVYFVFRISGGRSISKSSFEAILLTIIIFTIFSDFKWNTIPSILIKGIKRTLIIVPMMAASGTFIGVINLTGLVSKFGVYFSFIYQMNLYLALAVIGLIILFIGTALNTPTTYIISAIFFGPILLQRGYELLPIHFFFLYYASLGSITPPVAITSLTAASIADASFLKVSFKAMFLSLVAYLIPFSFILEPTILAPSFSIDFLFILSKLIIATILLVYALEFQYKKYIFLKKSIVFSAGLIQFFTTNYYFILISLFIIIYLYSLKKKEILI